jgi:hypothetical protein
MEASRSTYRKIEGRFYSLTCTRPSVICAGSRPFEAQLSGAICYDSVEHKGVARLSSAYERVNVTLACTMAEPNRKDDQWRTSSNTIGQAAN